jgi:YegS/Rv2252/BmrU family lipid kinase
VVDFVRQLLQKHDLDADIRLSVDRAHAVELAQQAVAQGYEQVLAVGGDGTVNAVLEGLLGSDTALGLIPLGTGNILATNLGVRRVADAVAALRVGHTRVLDVGSINQQYFAALAGVGLDAQVASSVDRQWKQYLGQWAFVTEGLSTGYKQESHHFQIELVKADGQREVLEESMWAAIVFNTPKMMPGWAALAKADPADGALDLVTFGSEHDWSMLRDLSAAFVASRDVSDIPGIAAYRATEVRIDCSPAWLWQADGEVGGNTPAEIRVHPAALRVVTAPPAE